MHEKKENISGIFLSSIFVFNELISLSFILFYERKKREKKVLLDLINLLYMILVFFFIGTLLSYFIRIFAFVKF